MSKLQTEQKEKVPIRTVSNLDLASLKAPKKVGFKSLSFSILSGLIIAGLFCATVYVFATYGSDEPYPIGNTLNPTCTPGATNCTVVYPVPYTGATGAVNLGSQNLSTSGTIGGGAITGTSFIIGANTLDTNEWAYLDGQNQAVKTTSSPTFANITNSGLTITRIPYASTAGLLVDDSLFTFNSTTHALTVSGMLFDAGSITDATGSISFDNENLSTSGTIGGGAITGTSFIIGANTLTTTEFAALDGLTTTDISNWNSKQAGHANLTSLAGMATTTGFVKQTSANTFGIDATTYMSNPMDAIGQIIYGGASGAATKLAAGLSGQALISGGAGAPAWSTATYPSTTTANQILYSTALNTIGGSAGLTYDSTSSGTLTAGTGTEVFTVLSTGEVGIGITAPTHPLDIVSSTLTPQLNIYYDPTHYSSFAVSSGGNLTITPSGGNATIAGTLTVGSSNTAGTLATRVAVSSPTEADANGSLVVDSGDAGRIYFRYGNTWHYVAQTAGFQIPNFETADPISGEQIEEGDIVLGMINQTLDDNALHGVWVKWDSVKAQLLAEARGELSQTGTWGTGSIAGVSTETLLDRVTNVLTSLGISIKDGVTSITTLATQNFSADTATIKGLQMVDKATGETYCTWIENGEWQKTKGGCGDIVAEPSIVATTSIPEAQVQPSVDEITQQVTEQITEQQTHVVEQVADQAAREASQQTAERVSQQIELQVQQEVTQQLEAQAQESTSAETLAPTEETSIPVEEQVQKQPPVEELAPVETLPVEEAPSVGDIIQESAAGLLDGMWNFVKWIFSFGVKGISSLPFAQKATAGLIEPIKALLGK